MILKCGEQGKWKYKELPCEVRTELNEKGYYEVTVMNNFGEPIETLACKSPECYLMSDSGRTIENLSPLKAKDCVGFSKQALYEGQLSGIVATEYVVPQERIR